MSTGLPPSTELTIPQDETKLAKDDPRIKALQAEIDLKDTNSILSFGAKAQSELQQVSQMMIGDVKNKDVGPAGDSIREMITTIRGFAVGKGDLREKPNMIERLMGRVAPIANFAAKYESVKTQIDRITEEMETHSTALSKDIKDLDTLYEKTKSFYGSLAVYIQAGEERLERAMKEEIPALEAELENAPTDHDKMIVANEVRDLRAATGDLERRIHDLKLTRQVTMQSMPAIRMIQEGDKSLVTKITSTLANTIPLWETQMAQAVTISRASKAAIAVKDATDLTNELLMSNADNLRDANKVIRTQTERGVFDIKALQHANSQLLATMEDSLKIADQGKAVRAENEVKLIAMEEQLRKGLMAASAKENQSSSPTL